jgi:hypothetical protein
MSERSPNLRELAQQLTELKDQIGHAGEYL